MVIQYNKVNGGLTCHHRHTCHCRSLPQLGCGLSFLRRLLPLPPSLGGDLVRDLSLVFLYLIYVELYVRGRSPGDF